MAAARLIMFTCPDVGGSNDPGKAAFNIPHLNANLHEKQPEEHDKFDKFNICGVLL
jgi:hypothetical protein